MKTLLVLAALSLAGALSAPAPVAGVTWQPIFDDALALSAAEGRVTFIAVNMDGERANDRMAEEVYEDKRIRELSTSTVNLVASNFTHSKRDGTCPRFGTITCAEHRRVDVDVRGRVLEPDEQGYVVAPQHVWLSPTGDVLLSVPYGVTTEELEWCFVAALTAVDPTFEWQLSAKARAPKRLVMKGVAATGAAGSLGSSPPTRAEALEIVTKLKRGARGAEARKLVKRLAQADEPEARDYMITYLRASASGGGRGAGGGRFGGGGGNDDEDAPDRRVTLLRWIGAASPPSYWEVCAEFISAGEATLRSEAVVALEQLAAPESLKLLSSSVRKEKDPRIKKNLFRAIGAAGGDESRARKLLLKQAGDTRNGLWRRNAIVALGFLAAHDDVKELLTEYLSEEEGEVREAALVAIALTRDVAWVETLDELSKAQETQDDEDLVEVLDLVLGVLKGAELATLEGTLTEVAEDEIPRERLFAAPVRERARGE